MRWYTSIIVWKIDFWILHLTLFPTRIVLLDLQLERPKNSAWEIAPSKLEAKKAAEDAAAEEESKCLAAEAAEKGGKSDEGGSAEYVL